MLLFDRKAAGLRDGIVAAAGASSSAGTAGRAAVSGRCCFLNVLRGNLQFTLQLDALQLHALGDGLVLQRSASQPPPSELAGVGCSVGKVLRDLLPAELFDLFQMSQENVVLGVPGRRRFAFAESVWRMFQVQRAAA